MSDILIKNIDKMKKNKAKIVLKEKGKTLTGAVREMLYDLAEEYEEKGEITNEKIKN